MSTRTVANKHRGGPRKMDIALRGRNVFWHGAVRKWTGLSDEELDREFILKDFKTGAERPIGRPRTFAAIHYRAADPGKILNKHGMNLVDLVAQVPKLEETRKAYLSPMWRLIRPPMPSEQEIQSIIADCLDSEGLYRATDQDALIGKAFLKDKAPFEYVFKEKYRNDLVKEVTANGHIDGLALIGALAREQALAFSFEAAQIFFTEFDFCLMNVAARYGIDVEVEKLIGWLAHFRIFSNRWDQIPTAWSRQEALASINWKRKEQGLKPLSAKSFPVAALALRYHHNSGAHQHNVVKRTEEIEWLIRNRERLNAQLKEYDRTHPHTFGPYPFMCARDIDDAFNGKHEVDDVQRIDSVEHDPNP